MSIELGYAPLVLPSGRRVSVVDVPGHERFVKTMVAGATGIDLYLMVVAADDGVMPQTLEHAEVLAALGIEQGVVAITKADRADPERAAAEAADLFPGAEVVACSARTGDGVADVAAALERAAERVTPRGEGRRAGPAVLHIDRAFTIHGAGTVVTGTLWSGALAVGDTARPAARAAARPGALAAGARPAGRAGVRGAARGGQPRRDRPARRRPRRCARRPGGGGRAGAGHRCGPGSQRRAARPARHGASRHAGACRRGWRRSATACGRYASSLPCSPPRATGSSCARSRRPTRSAAARCSTREPAGTAATPTLLARLERLRRGEPEPAPRQAPPAGRRTAARAGADAARPARGPAPEQAPQQAPGRDRTGRRRRGRRGVGASARTRRDRARRAAARGRPRASLALGPRRRREASAAS